MHHSCFEVGIALDTAIDDSIKSYSDIHKRVQMVPGMWQWVIDAEDAYI